MCGKSVWVVSGDMLLPPAARSVAFAVQDASFGLLAACSATSEPALFLTGGNLLDRTLARRLLERIDWNPGVKPSIELAAGADPFNGYAFAGLPTGASVHSDSNAARFTLEGDCGPTTILGTYEEVQITGWHSELEVDVRDANIVVTLFPGSAAVNNMSLQTNSGIVLSVPARSGYRLDVPAGWQIACPEGLDPACGTMGPRRVGPPGKTDAYLAAPRGVLRIYDWVGSSADDAKEELLPLPVNGGMSRELRLILEAEPPCRDVLRRECGIHSDDKCLPLTDLRGRTLAPWFGEAPAP